MRAAGEGVLSTATPEPTAVLVKAEPRAGLLGCPGSRHPLRPQAAPRGPEAQPRGPHASPPGCHGPATPTPCSADEARHPGKSRWPAPDGRPHCPAATLCLRRGRDQPQGPLGWTHRWKRLPARPPRPTLTRSSMLTLPSLFSSRAEAKLTSLLSGMCLICFMALMSSATLMTVSLGDTARTRHSWRPLQPHWGPVGQTCPRQPLPPELPRPVLWEHPADLDTETETTAPSRVSCACAAAQQARPLQWG